MAAAATVAAPEAASTPPPTPREQWERAWNDTADALARGDYRLAQAPLQTCMQLSAQQPDTVLLARSLAAIEPAPYSEERLDVESRLVGSLMAEQPWAETAKILDPGARTPVG